MAEVVSALGYITKNETKNVIKSQKSITESLEAKTLAASEQACLIKHAYLEGAVDSAPNGSNYRLTSFSYEDRKKGDVTIDPTGIITIGTAGMYLLAATVRFTFNNTGGRRAFFAPISDVNRALADCVVQASTVGETTINISVAWYAPAGYQLGLYVNQTSGGALVVNNGAPAFFSIVRLS